MQFFILLFHHFCNWYILVLWNEYLNRYTYCIPQQKEHFLYINHLYERFDLPIAALFVASFWADSCFRFSRSSTMIWKNDNTHTERERERERERESRKEKAYFCIVDSVIAKLESFRSFLAILYAVFPSPLFLFL